MEYHFRMLKAMNILDTGLINIHIGGAYGDKTRVIKPFPSKSQKIAKGN